MTSCPVGAYDLAAMCDVLPNAGDDSGSQRVASPGEGPALLILDDMPLLRRSLSRFVDDIVPVAEAGTVDEAFAVHAEREVGGAILDVRLGDGQSGLDVLAHLQSERREPLPIIVLTAYEREELDLDPAAHHAIYVHKPATPELLRPVLRRFAKRVVAWPELSRHIDDICARAGLRNAEAKLVRTYFHLNRSELGEALRRRPGTVESTITSINYKLKIDHLSDLWHELAFDLALTLREARL